MEHLIARAKEDVSQQVGAVSICNIKQVTSTYQSVRHRLKEDLLAQGLLTAPEAEHIIETLRSFGVDQVYAA